MLYNDDDADSDELGVRKSGFKFCEFGGFCIIVLIFWTLFIFGWGAIDTSKKIYLLKAQNKGYKSLKKTCF